MGVSAKRVAVLGGGSGGFASAADLAMRGYEVNLCCRSKRTLEEIIEAGGINARGPVINGKTKLNLVTTEIREAIEDVELIEIIVPAFAQDQISSACIPYLKERQTIAFYGKGGGSLGLLRELRLSDQHFDGLMGEASTLPYSCRKTAPAEITIFFRTKILPVAAFPSSRNNDYLLVVSNQYPAAILFSNVLEILLMDLNSMIHPVPVILNAGRIERAKGDFYMYKEGITQSVARVIEAVDRERLAVMETFGFVRKNVAELHSQLGFGPEGTILRSLTEAAALIRGPDNLKERHLTEDVPYGLVPIASLGRISGIATPLIDSMVTIASALNSQDYWAVGRTAEKMGIADMSRNELIQYVTEGKISRS